MKRILIIDRELSSRELMLQLLKKESVQLFAVEDGVRAVEVLMKRPFDMIFSDFEGIKALDRLKRRPLGVPLIQLRGSEEEGHKKVTGVLSKPIHPQSLIQLLKEFAIGKTKAEVIAESPAMKQVIERAKKIAKSHSNVFIVGESGTGKEVIAGLIHAESKRTKAPFVKVNCAALPDTLIESEFFGHEKGAFTGAHSKRIGRFERADHGTLLLDEISEIPVALQAKLLRVIQEQEFERVGGTEQIHINVRLISTSNQNMREVIDEKKFREDLYYRLNVIPIYLPPLRERVEDILPLAELFLKKVCDQNQIPLKTLSPEAQSALCAYPWPGNIRELRNVIEHSVALDYGDVVEERHLFFDVHQKSQAKGISSGMTLKECEKILILEALKRHQNNRTRAADELGISVRTLRNKLKLYESR